MPIPTLQALIADALAPRTNEIADWITEEEAVAIVAEAQATNSPTADEMIVDLMDRGLGRFPVRLDRLNQPAPPTGRIWLDDFDSMPFKDRPIEMQFNRTGQVMSLLNAYLVSKDSTRGSKHLQNVVRDVAGKTFHLQAGRTLSLAVKVPTPSFREHLYVHKGNGFSEQVEIKRGATWLWGRNATLPYQQAFFITVDPNATPGDRIRVCFPWNAFFEIIVS
jgi:hypothetical protein